MTTRALSVWRVEPSAPDGITFDDLLPPLSTADAAALADYLDAGTVVERRTTVTPDPWAAADPAPRDAPAAVPQVRRTDGRWRWDDAVGYLVRTHRRCPDPEFLADVRARGFLAPEVDAATVAAVKAEFGAGTAVADERRLRIDGSQLLPPGDYCRYRGRVFEFDPVTGRDDLVRLWLRRGETAPEQFRAASLPVHSTAPFAQLVVPAAEVESPVRVRVQCRYKNTSFHAETILGGTLWCSIGGERRGDRNRAHPTLGDWSAIPNAEPMDQYWIRAGIDVAEAAELAMAIVPIPAHDPGPPPRAAEVFLFPSAPTSPYLTADGAVAAARAHLQTPPRDRPGDGAEPVRLRDGWRVPGASDDHGAVVLVADDGAVLTAPATTPETELAARLSAGLRERCPALAPPVLTDEQAAALFR